LSDPSTNGCCSWSAIQYRLVDPLARNWEDLRPPARDSMACRTTVKMPTTWGGLCGGGARGTCVGVAPKGWRAGGRRRFDLGSREEGNSIFALFSRFQWQRRG
jgi:hypothetical protein